MKPTMGTKEWHPTEPKPFRFATEQRHSPNNAKEERKGSATTSPRTPSKTQEMGSKEWHPTEAKPFNLAIDQRLSPENKKNMKSLPSDDDKTTKSPTHTSSRDKSTSPRGPEMGSKDWQPTQPKEFNFLTRSKNS